MAQTALTRVTGKVLALPEPRRGISTKSGEPRAWEIATANVLIANQNVTVVQLPNTESGFVRPRVDDVVDYLCEVSIWGQNVQTTVLGVFPSQYDADSLRLQAELGASV